MKRTVFFLSGSQKRMLGRGAQIKVIVPAPEDDPDDWTEWARSLFPEDGDLIVGAEEPYSVPVAVERTTDNNGLTGWIGHLKKRRNDKRFCVMVEVVEVTFAPKGRTRYYSNSVKWPGKAVSGGWSFPPENGEEKHDNWQAC